MADPSITERNIEIVLARLRYGTTRRAAESLGLSYATARNHIDRSLMLTESADFTQLVVRLWPRIKDRVEIELADGQVYK